MARETELGRLILTTADDTSSGTVAADKIHAVFKDSVQTIDQLEDKFLIYLDLITDVSFLGNGNPGWMEMYGDPHPYLIIARHIYNELQSVDPNEGWLANFHESLKSFIVTIEKMQFNDRNTENRSLDRLVYALAMSRTCALKISRGNSNKYQEIQGRFEVEHKRFIRSIDRKFE